MFSKFKNIFIFLLCFVLMFTLLPNNSTKAEESFTDSGIQEKIIAEELKENLSNENISVDTLDFSSENIQLEASVQNMKGRDVKVILNVVAGSEYLDLITYELNNSGEKIKKEYKVKVEQFEEDEFKATFEDSETGEVFKYDSEEGVASIAFLIPIGIVMSPALLTALFHTGAMIIVGGAAYVVATQAKKSDKYSHFSSVVKGGSVYIGKGLSKSKAISRIKKGKDTWSVSKSQAKKVAAGANTNGSPINEVDQYNGKPKKGYYYHWHPYKRTPKAHAFYGNPVK